MTTFTIPNEADAGFPDQAEPDSRDFGDILAASLNLTGVVSGCAVTAQGTPDMTVAVASGVVVVAGTSATVTSGNVTITAADATNPRFDLICVASDGTKSAVAGTAASNAVFPDPAGKCVIAAVYVPANDTAINTNQIVDKRVLVKPWVPAVGGTFTGSVTMKGPIPWIDVTAYGAVGDGSTNDATAIQAAIDAVPSSGGVVYFPIPATYYAITASLTIRNSRIALIGQRRAAEWNSSASSTGVTIRWKGTNGGGPMLDIKPVTNAFALHSITVKGITFNGWDGGTGYAATGISLINVCMSRFEDLEIRACSTVALDMNSQAATVGAKGVYYCTFNAVSIRQDDSVPSGIGIRMDGLDNTGNTNHNHFYQVHVHHYNGHGFQFKNTDTNFLYGCVAQKVSGGTGYGIEFNGSNTSGLHARYNQFFGWSEEIGGGGVISRGTGLTYPASNNSFWGWTEGNSNPAPTLETGASMWYTTDSGKINALSAKFTGAPTTVLDMTAVSATYGIDFKGGTWSSAPMRLANNSFIVGRNSTDSADLNIVGVDTSNTINFQTQARFAAGLIVANTFNITFSQTTGSKIGTNVAEKLGFWNATPIVQPGSAGGLGAITVTNYTGAARSFNRSSYTMDQLADLVCQLHLSIKTAGLVA